MQLKANMKRSRQRSAEVAPAKEPAAPMNGKGAVVLAALALPGVWVPPAHAESAPEKGVVAIKYLHYQDSQPGLKRITVNSPSVFVMAPIGKEWAVEGSMVVDTLSGATPRWQSSISSASVMSEERAAGDVKVTRYYDRSSYSLGLSHSKEHDYQSTAVSVSGSWSTADNNTTLNIGFGASKDKINPTNGGVAGVRDQKKDSNDLIVGVTQALSSTDLLQVNVTYSQGKGYYNDPYKTLDERPNIRKQAALLTRWNHYLEDDRSTVRTSYRFYKDNFGINAHTFQAEWAKPVSDQFTVTPLLRYYSQSAATFYTDALYDASGFPIFPNLAPGQVNSGDQRLSAFGAVTLGLKADYKLTPDWSVDGKFEQYEQRSAWRMGGKGSIGLDPFRATSVQFGANYKF
jgi:hypothetical protein